MNRFQSITRQIERLCSQTRHPSSPEQTAEAKNGGSGGNHSRRSRSASRQTGQKALAGSDLQTKRSPQVGSPLLLVVAVISLTGVMGVRFYNQPKLSVGRRAPETFVAPADASIPDEKTTEEKRRAAQIGEVSVLVIDPTIDRDILQKIRAAIAQVDRVREAAGPFPYVDTGILSTDTQIYIRLLAEWQWQDLLDRVEQTTFSNDRFTSDDPEPQKSASEKFADPAESDRLQRQAYLQLSSYQMRSAPEAFSALNDRISEARRDYAKALNLMSEQQTAGENELYDRAVLNWSDAVWLQAQSGLRSVAREMLAQGIAPGVPDDIIRQATSLHLKGTVPLEAQSFAHRVLIEFLKPNLIKDPVATRRRAELAAQKVEPVIVNVKKGEAIVTAGETITQRQFVVLDHFGKSERGVNWKGLMGFVGLVGGAIGIVLLVQKRFRPGLRRRDYLLLLLLTSSTPLLVLLKMPATSLPAVGLLTGSFYGSAVGVTVVGLLSAILPVGMEIEMIPLVASAAGGILGSLLAGQLRSREELALLGGGVGLTQGAVYLVVTLMVSSTASAIWYVLLGDVALQFLEGLAWSIVALGLSPYLEHVFDLITPIRLAQLANPNRPLLKRLATEAPGTFQHTMFVATLAEAAAGALGCNVELVRTGTLYHDIGKMHDPLGFIENQMGGPNKHDDIDDPWKSANIIKKHVSEGLAMARKCRLPKAIQAFIPEHQGRMLIAYFYYQAQQQAKENTKIVVKEEDFRYDGPRPQSRETGIVMLADSCEAALRSLKDATHEEALQMVNKILRARWQDNQLVDSGLTREDMGKIAEIFVRVWEQVNHKRIAYPKGVFGGR